MGNGLSREIFAQTRTAEATAQNIVMLDCHNIVLMYYY